VAITSFPESKSNGAASSTNGTAKPEEKKGDAKSSDAKPSDAKSGETKPIAVAPQQAKPTPPPPPPADAALARAMELLKAGGFTRRMSWRDRRALRKIERNIDRVRQSLQDAFPDSENSIAKSLDSLAHIEVTARLEMMRARPVKK
jgi:hypothetical protein